MTVGARRLRSSRRWPRGISLLEMVVAMGLMASLGVLVGQIMFSLSRAEQAATRDLLLERRLLELALRFRDDVHTAAHVRLEAAGSSLVLTPPGGGSVTYTLQGETLQRHASGNRPVRTSFHLPGCTLRFLVRDDPPQTVELVITRPWPQWFERVPASAPRATISWRAVRGKFPDTASTEIP